MIRITGIDPRPLQKKPLAGSRLASLLRDRTYMALCQSKPSVLWTTWSAACRASQPADPLHMFAKTIRTIGGSHVDPYAILGVLIEGAAHTLVQHVAIERQADAVARMMQLCAR
jgi:hypothetical protein